MHLGPIYLPKNAITHCHLVLMARTARNLKLLLFLHFSSLAPSWKPGHSFYWQGAADAQQCSKPKQFIHGNRSAFRGHSNSKDYSYIFTFSALTLLTCSLLFHCVTPGLALEQSCSSSSFFLSSFYLARI